MFARFATWRWGKGEWTGAWSDADSAWTPALREAVQHDPRPDDGLYTRGDLFSMLPSYIAGKLTVGWTLVGGISATNGEASYGAYVGQEPYELVVMCQAMVRCNNSTRTI